MKRWRFPALCAVAVAGAAFLVPLSTPAGQATAAGVVFHDRNANGTRDSGEPGLAGVRVSNGEDIVVTDSNGRWILPVTDDTMFFVIKPRGWMTPVDHLKLPKFYYVHKPNGSPTLRYKGVDPTGPLPRSIDFALTRQEEPTKFKALFFGDTQPRNEQEVDYLTHDVIEPIVGKTDAAFGVTLGDIVFDDLSLFDRVNSAIALIGIPWYNVLGNHDMNFDAKVHEHADETFERVYGPSYYSFDYGPTHFVVLNDVRWHPATEENPGRYTGGFGDKQLAWLRKDLSLVPKNQLVVLMMHIPLHDTADKEAVFRILEDRPYALSVSAHTHYMEHFFYTEEHGWKGPEPHHHVVNVTTCGSWWQGAPDERGIPHTTMRDGAPNGYTLFTFDGNQYSIAFRAAGRADDYQMNIYAPDNQPQGEAALVKVNVFGGSERTTVEMRVDNGDWQPMRQVRKPDPAYEETYRREAGILAPFRRSPVPMLSPHLWESLTPADLPPGPHRIEVRAKDMFGQEFRHVRLMHVTPQSPTRN